MSLFAFLKYVECIEVLVSKVIIQFILMSCFIALGGSKYLELGCGAKSPFLTTLLFSTLLVSVNSAESFVNSTQKR